MKTSHVATAVVPVLLVIGGAFWLITHGPLAVTPLERAHRACRASGMSDSETDGLIESMRLSGAGPDELLSRHRNTYVDGRPEPVSFPCIEAMIQAALHERGGYRGNAGTDAVYAKCEACGLGAVEIAELIETMRTAPGTRQEKLGSFRATFEKPTDAELCEPCAVAVLEAAGVE